MALDPPRPAHRASSFVRWVSFVALLSLTVGCEEDTAKEEQKKLREEHLPGLANVVDEDVKRHLEGIRDAADMLAPGFAVEEAAAREKQMRAGLKYVQEPPKGISEFITSPMSFLAAVDRDGVVVARDAEPDRMKGMKMAKRFPVVRKALEEGAVGHALGEFPADDGPSSWSILFAAPVSGEGERVGAVVAGIPLWRMAQRLSRQMRVEHATEIEQQGLVLWAYLIKGDRLFHKGTPPELDAQLPPPREIWKKLEGEPGVMTGHLALHGRTYGYGAIALPEVGDDVALVAIRGDFE